MSTQVDTSKAADKLVVTIADFVRAARSVVDADEAIREHYRAKLKKQRRRDVQNSQEVPRG